jgi:hypothetical protein
MNEFTPYPWDALDYWGAQVSWMRISVLEMTTLIRIKGESGLKAGHVSTYEVPKMFFNALN